MTDNDNRKLNILFATGECLPFCANGGVADMCFALPKYLKKTDKVDVRVVLPLYSKIPDEYKSKFKLIGERTVNLNWRSEYCGIYEYELNDITYYFIDNKRYFERDNLFGYGDDIERFSFFSKAVLDMLPIISFYPDIIHTNDWQSGMVCTFLKILAWQNPHYEHIKTLHCIHNLTYQGITDFNAVRDVWGVDDKFTYLFDFFGQANIMKSTLLCADQVVTVSDTYKEEILNTEKGNGLQGLLQTIKHKLCSVINGIDYEYYNPATDPTIYQTFDENSLELRKINKAKLQEELAIDVDENAPLFCYIGYMANHKGLDLLTQILDEYIENGMQFVAIGGGVPEYEEFMRGVNERHPGRAHISFGYNRHLAKKMYAGADFLMNIASVEPCGLCPLIANKYGTLPVVYSTGGIKDNVSDFKYPNGNGYVFNDYDVTSLRDLFDRCLRDFEKKDKIENYILSGMKQSFDIAECAEKYLEIYNEM